MNCFVADNFMFKISNANMYLVSKYFILSKNNIYFSNNLEWDYFYTVTDWQNL